MIDTTSSLTEVVFELPYGHQRKEVRIRLDSFLAYVKLARTVEELRVMVMEHHDPQWKIAGVTS